MARASGQQSAALVDAGWAELAHGRWTEARLRFEEALLGEESPRAFEGLSWAAWWLDDAATVFDTRERAYGLYRQRGDAADAARMATWLASDQLDFHGAAIVAGGWLRRARRLLEPLEQGPDHGWLAFHEGYLALVAGDSSSASEHATSTSRLGREFGIVDLEMLGLALEGAALVASTRVDEGMAYLDEATTIALEGEAAIPISSAWTCCFLVSACMKSRDLERAAEWCDRIEQFAERYGSRYMLAFCRAEYGSVYLARGRWSDAEAMLEASIEEFLARGRRGSEVRCPSSRSFDDDRDEAKRRTSSWTEPETHERESSVEHASHWMATTRCRPSNASRGCCAACRRRTSSTAFPSSSS